MPTQALIQSLVVLFDQVLDRDYTPSVVEYNLFGVVDEEDVFFGIDRNVLRILRFYNKGIVVVIIAVIAVIAWLYFFVWMSAVS
ncbi:hypothetical protein EJ08DRAFT_654021 [Tothia fuscella]|uniref:Uncharacterized protein n=1 Tax=Tothia fuscella TaxID=1048955 RepID=A0A9P4TTF7_9PEZI|nr:hypothetical protein EJ08DRAFT_654021 [Tothia fuscella]